MNPNPKEATYSFVVPTFLFVGKKPTAVYFGEDERIDVKSWRGVYEEIIKRCNSNPQTHEKLMYLRDKVAGRERKFLSSSPEGMTRVLKIDEDMYAEVHYGSATLMHILRERILAPAGFDYSDVYIAVKFE